MGAGLHKSMRLELRALTRRLDNNHQKPEIRPRAKARPTMDPSPFSSWTRPWSKQENKEWRNISKRQRTSWIAKWEEHKAQEARDFAKRGLAEKAISAVVESKKGTSATVKSHEGTNANVESKKKKIVEVMDLEEKAIPKGMIRRYYLRRLSKRPCRWRLSILGKRLQR